MVNIIKSVILVSVSPIIVTQNGMFRARAPALVCRQGWSKKFQKWTQFNSPFNVSLFLLHPIVIMRKINAFSFIANN